MPRTIIWFRNDLRLRDNAAVAEAVQSVKDGSAADVVPVFCFDPKYMSAANVIDRHAHKRFTGEPKMGANRAQFQLESVNALKSALRGIGSDLYIYYDSPEKVLPGLMGNDGQTTILAHEEPTYEEQQTDRRVRSAVAGKAKLRLVWGHTLFHIEDLPFSEDLHDLPDVFTPFRNKVESKSRVRAELPAPKANDLPLPKDVPATPEATWDALPLAPHVKAAGPQRHPNTAFPFKGGEEEALKRLKYYLWDKDFIADYFNTRNGMLGADYSTKFSPWLAHGCVSPRTIYHDVRKYERSRTENKSTYWVIFELIWRDFYRFFSVKYGTKIFFEDGTTGQMLSWNQDPEVFQQWKEGRTGMPLVDANMRELAATGFMSNRGRQNVASYLVLDLGVDWRLGADWFEHNLLDHDVTSNWGNWVAAAGLTGGRINKFNITKQSKDYDAEGDYVRAWIPELKDVPAAYVHEPWQMSKAMQEQFGVQIGVDYPNPISAKRMAKPHGGSRYPDTTRFNGGKGRGGGGKPRGGRGGGGKGRGTGRQPVQFY